MSISYGVLSTYPPTQCGLATFSKALVETLVSERDQVGVIAVVDERERFAQAEVTHQWVRREAGGAAAAAAALNRYDVAVIQHEYGIFGGPDGIDVLDVVRALRVPVVVVLHTVLVTPMAGQRAILEELVARSAAVVTMTQTARQRLIDHYPVDPAAVQVIPHGAVDNRQPIPARSPRSSSRSPIVLTWGLLGEGKGIEWAIEAMAQLTDLRPRPRYRVVGQTHPKVVEQHGERYRDGLMDRAARLGVSDMVEFDARYLARTDLNRLVQEADVVLLPYDSREQVTSGVLIEAITAGKPVVSTGFPHAQELLASGSGLIVARQNPTAIAAALHRVLTEPGLATAMAAESNRIAPALLWPAVAEQYRRLAADALRDDAVLATA